jgi:hypothetical protein
MASLSVDDGVVAIDYNNASVAEKVAESNGASAIGAAGS